jgi:U2-associated protein SR140
MAFANKETAEKPLQYSLTLKNLHPKMTVSEVKRLIPDPPLKIDKSQAITLRLDPFENRGESTPQIAVIKLEVGISADDVDRATSDMDGKIYLGEGYWLRIERTTSMTAVQKVVHPFNAQLHTDGPYAGELVVQVKLPTELPMVKLINRIAERVSQGMDGVKFEAFLMNQEEIQKDEDYAWLWDSDSSDGVYYRWRLWELKTYEYRTPAERKALRTGPQPIFDGGPIWLAPRLPKFQFVSELADFLDDSDYDSQEDSDEEDARKYNTGGLNDREEEPFKWLNALQRVKLTYMLRNLPVTTALLKKYHVAMVTSFGCRHAAIACEEIVEMVVSNVFRPVAFTRAEFESEKPTADQITSAKLVGLHIICDLCAAGATAPGSGYLYRRSVLEAMQRRNMFGHLGRQYLDLDLSPPKKKRFEAAVKAMLKVMEEHNLWDKASHDGLHENFDNPELTAAEQEAKDKEEAEKGRVKAQGKVELRAVVDEKDGVAEAGEGIKTTTTSLKAETTEADSKRIDKTSDTKARIQAAIAERTAGVQIQATPVDTTKFASNFSKGYKAAIQKAAEEKAKVTRRKSEDVDMFADDDSE